MFYLLDFFCVGFVVYEQPCSSQWHFLNYEVVTVFRRRYAGLPLDALKKVFEYTTELGDRVWRQISRVLETDVVDQVFPERNVFYQQIEKIWEVFWS